MQQSKLEFHDSNPRYWLFDEEKPVASRREALNWRRACFLSSGQHRQLGVKKMTSARASTRISLVIGVFLNSLFVGFGYEMLGGVV